MTLQGLSGTGKGTTVEKLKEKLPNAQTWSGLMKRFSLLGSCFFRFFLGGFVESSKVSSAKFLGKPPVSLERIGPRTPTDFRSCKDQMRTRGKPK